MPCVPARGVQYAFHMVMWQAGIQVALREAESEWEIVIEGGRKDRQM